MTPLYIIALAGAFIAMIHPHTGRWITKVARSIVRRRPREVFDSYYVDSRQYYLYRFRSVPNTTYIDDIEANKAFAYIREHLRTDIFDIHQACRYDREAGKQYFDRTLFVMRRRILIEIGHAYVKILYPPAALDFIHSLMEIFSKYKTPEKAVEYEINIISWSVGSGLELKRLNIQPTALDVGLFYNDDFAEVDARIRERLNRQNDKGIVLLHGLPGTGKTTYLRYLIGQLQKKVLFVSPSVAGNLMNPEFIDLLVDNPNSVLVIEDAENIMMDRKFNRDSSVSNLLNLSDGLLSDCVSVQIVCTFNSALNLIDPALMRKGRLIARYEFGKLSVPKAKALSKHLGLDTIITQPMTIAEIANPDDDDGQVHVAEVLGFRRKETLEVM